MTAGPVIYGWRTPWALMSSPPFVKDSLQDRGRMGAACPRAASEAMRGPVERRDVRAHLLQPLDGGFPCGKSAVEACRPVSGSAASPWCAVGS
jgi:hypothetical protein